MAENRSSVIWSPEAEDDLVGIWSYYAGEATPGIADNQLRAIDLACRTLSEMPQSGRRRDELLSGLRVLPGQAVRHLLSDSWKFD